MILLIEKKGLNHPEQRQHEHILNTGISLMVWTRLGSSLIYSYELCQEKERSGWWHVNKVNLVCAEKMRNVSFFNILVVCGYVTIIHYQYDYLWLYLCHIMCLTLYLFHVEHSTGGSKFKIYIMTLRFRKCKIFLLTLFINM